MTRARRVHQGERTQSEALRDYGGTVQEIAEATEPEHDEIIDGNTGEVVGYLDTDAPLLDIPWVGCKSCAKHLDAKPADTDVWHVVTAPTGMQHLTERPRSKMTVCGREVEKGWKR